MWVAKPEVPVDKNRLRLGYCPAELSTVGEQTTRPAHSIRPPAGSLRAVSESDTKSTGDCVPVSVDPLLGCYLLNCYLPPRSPRLALTSHCLSWSSSASTGELTPCDPFLRQTTVSLIRDSSCFFGGRAGPGRSRRCHRSCSSA